MDPSPISLAGPFSHCVYIPFIYLSTSTMRWSLFSLVALLAVLIADVTALPMPQDGSSDLVLERRTPTEPKKPQHSKRLVPLQFYSFMF